MLYNLYLNPDICGSFKIFIIQVIATPRATQYIYVRYVVIMFAVALMGN